MMNAVPLARRRRTRLPWLAISGLLAMLCPNPSGAGTITYDFTGRLTSAITVGGNTIPDGSSFSGQLTYDYPQAGVVTSFYGGPSRCSASIP
jgi:hypothetical protein